MQTSSHITHSKNRIAILDGFRCLCIIAVILFHYLVRFTKEYAGVDYYPYHSQYSHFYFFRYGYLGVHCFFIISGFVIFMTLEKSNNIKQFAIKRFIRLWPTLLICCLVTFTVLVIFPFEGLSTQVKYFLPSLTITQPHIWERLFGLNLMHYIDGVEWSLVCEVSFYIVASVLYFTNRKYFFRNWLIFVSALIALYFSLKPLGLSRIDNYLSPLLFPMYMDYFTLGIYLYFLYTNQKLRPGYHIATISLLIIQLVFLQHIKEDIFIICFLGLFMLFIYKPEAVSFFSSKIIAKVGFMSYAIYLLHNNIGIVLINKFALLFNSSSALVTVLPTIAVIILTAVGIEKLVGNYINPFLKKKLL